jgi:hypothetical protein
VDQCGDPEGDKNDLLPTKAKKLQTAGSQMEQRGLWEHLSRKKNVRTKTRRPPGSNYTNRLHSHSAAAGERHQEATRRKIQAGGNPIKTEISGSMVQGG